MLGVVCAAIASVMSTEVIKLITGIGESLLGRLMIYDALEMSYRTIAIRRDPCNASRPAITTLVDYEQLCGAAPAASTDAATGEAAITPRQLRELLDSGAKLALIDVREPVEFDIVHLDGAQLIPQSSITSGRAWQSCRPTACRCCTARPGCGRPRRWRWCARPDSATRCICRAGSWPGRNRCSPT